MTMNQKQEKDIIRVLAQAGKQDLAQTFARSRGYQIKGDYKQTLKPIAQKIARDVGKAINKAVEKVDTPDMPYKGQYVLEELIKLLKAAV
jgi:hypothetical protein